MGRPIKNKYINPYGSNYTAGDGAQRPGIGGESLTSTGGNVTIASITRGSGYTSATATISAPNLTNGTAATVGTVYLFSGNGAIKNVELLTTGSGYTAPATLTFFGSNTGTATATVSVDVATTRANAILANCFFTGSSYGITTADILKARGARTFVCKNGGTPETLKLVTSPNNNPYIGGTMTITATFDDASTFNVAKITGRKVYSSTGQSYKWTLTTGSAANVSASDITVVVSSL